MRNLSSDTLRALFAQESGEVFAPLLVIDHEDLVNPVRIVGDTVNLTKGLDTYTAAPFSYDLPSDQEGKIQEIKIRVSNVSRELVQMIRSLQSSPTMTFEIVRVADPTDTVAGPRSLCAWIRFHITRSP